MQLYMWQRNIVGWAHIIKDCSEVPGALDDAPDDIMRINLIFNSPGGWVDVIHSIIHSVIHSSIHPCIHLLEHNDHVTRGPGILCSSKQVALELLLVHFAHGVPGDAVHPFQHLGYLVWRQPRRSPGLDVRQGRLLQKNRMRSAVRSSDIPLPKIKQ